MLEILKQINITLGLQSLWNNHPYIWAGLVAVSLALAWFFTNWIVFSLRFWHMQRMSKNLVYMEVSMPRTDSQKDREKAVEKDFREKVGIMEQLYRSVWEINRLNFWNLVKSWFWNTDTISFEIVAKEKKVFFYVVTYKKYADIIEKQVTSYYSDAEIRYVNDYTPAFKKLKLRTYYLYQKEHFAFPIRTYKTLENDPLNDLTNVLSKLDEGEIAAIQMVINPVDDSWRKTAKDLGTAMFKGKKTSKSGLMRIPVLGTILGLVSDLLFGLVKTMNNQSATNMPGADGGDKYVRMLQTDEEIAKHIGEKANQPGFEVALQVVSGAKTQTRADEIMNNMVLAFSMFRHEGMNSFKYSPMLFNKFYQGILMYEFKRRMPGFFSRDSIMSPEECASLFHFPDSHYNPSAIINWLAYKVLPAPLDTPKEGVIIGKNVYRGQAKDIRILEDDRTRHHYIIGKSGSGKSALLTYMARQDIAMGNGVGIVDPHGDLIEDILKYIPKERVKDVVLFDPSDMERPMGLNLLEAHTDEEKDMASLEAMEIFIKLFGDEIFGPRIQHYFRNGCLTLMDDAEEGATIIDVPRLFVDDAFQKYKVAKVKNPVVRSFWENEMAKTGAREKEEMIPYFSSKFGPFITNTLMRNIIGQSKSAFDFRKIMDEKKILLINLSKGKIGDLNAQLLGLIIVSKLQMAAMSRVDMPEDQRAPFYLYCDEFQNFATDSFASILSEARKYKLALIMAHQYISQLTKTPTGHDDTRIRDAVFGNVGTMMSFKIGAEDAEYMAKEYAPLLSEQDILGIANYKAYLKLNINNTTSRPFSVETVWDPKGETTGCLRNEKVADVVKQYARLKYGRKKAFVDQEVCARVGIELEE